MLVAIMACSSVVTDRFGTAVHQMVEATDTITIRNEQVLAKEKSEYKVILSIFLHTFFSRMFELCYIR